MTRGEAAVLVAHLLCLAGAIFAFGAVTWDARAALAATLGICLLATAPLMWGPREPFPLLGPALVYLGWAWAHAVPLPGGWVGALAPVTAAARARLGMDPGGPLTVVPAEIPLELPLLGLTLLVAVGMWHLLRTPRAQGITAAAVVAIASAAAALAWAQRAFHAERTYFFLPIDGGELARRFGPLVNANHDGTLFAVGALLAGALAAERAFEGRRGAGALGALGLFLGASVWGSGSQGALVALGAAAVGLGIVSLRASHRRWADGILLALVGGMGVALAVGPKRLALALADVTGHDPAAVDQRLDLWAEALRLLGMSPWVGTGPHTFQWVHPTVSARPQYAWVRAHNDWLQALAEGGLPAALILGWAAWAGARALRRGAWVANPRRAWALGFCAAAAVPLLHAGVDFPMQIPALALLTAVLIPLALAAAHPVDGDPRPSKRRGLLPAAVATSALCFGALGFAAPTAAQTALLRVEAQLEAPPPEGDIPLPPPAPGASDLDADDLAHAPAAALERQGVLSHRAARQDLDKAAGHLSRAQDLFEAARLAAPTFHRAFRGLGWARLYLGDVAGALPLLEQAIELAPRDPVSWQYLARYRRLQRDGEGAKEAYRQALAYADRRAARDVLKEVAIAWPDEVGALLPPRAEVWLWYGQGLVADGRWSAARGALEEALRLAQGPREQMDALEPLALTLLRLGELDAARALLKGAPSEGIGEAAQARLHGDLLLADGDAAHALAYFRRARSLSPSVPHAVRVLSALAELKRWPELEKEAKEAAAGLPGAPGDGQGYQEAELYRLYGLALLRQGRPGEALLPLAASVGAQPGHGPAIALLVEAHLALGDAPRAREIAEAHLAAHPDDLRVWLALGDLAKAQGDVDGARQAYRGALKARPGWKPATDALRALGPPGP